MKAKLTRVDFVNFSATINTIKEPEKVSWKVQFKNALSKTKRLIKIEIDSLSESLTDKIKFIKKEKEKLDAEFCKVKEGHDIEKEGSKALEVLMDKENKIPMFVVLFQLVYIPMYVLQDGYTEKEYEAKFTEIMENGKETLEEVQKFLEEEITINVHSVKCEFVPGLKQDELDMVSFMIED